MSDGSNAVVAVKQSASSDRNIDASLMSDGTYRQRVDAIRVAELLENVVALLNILINRTPNMDVLTGRPMSPLTAAVTVSSGTVTSVTAVAGVTAVGGYAAIYDQISQFNAGAYQLRNNIATS